MKSKHWSALLIVVALVGCDRSVEPTPNTVSSTEQWKAVLSAASFTPSFFPDSAAQISAVAHSYSRPPASFVGETRDGIWTFDWRPGTDSVEWISDRTGCKMDSYGSYPSRDSACQALAELTASSPTKDSSFLRMLVHQANPGNFYADTSGFFKKMAALDTVVVVGSRKRRAFFMGHSSFVDGNCHKYGLYLNEIGAVFFEKRQESIHQSSLDVVRYRALEVGGVKIDSIEIDSLIASILRSRSLPAVTTP